jgi:hypothetical protein
LSSPEKDVDNEDLESLANNHPVGDNFETNVWAAGFWVFYHLIQKITILINEEGRDSATPEEEETHT